MSRICKQHRLYVVVNDIGRNQVQLSTYVVIVTQDDVSRLSKLVLHPQFRHRGAKGHKLCRNRAVWRSQRGDIKRLDDSTQHM